MPFAVERATQKPHAEYDIGFKDFLTNFLKRKYISTRHLLVATSLTANEIYQILESQE